MKSIEKREVGMKTKHIVLIILVVAVSSLALRAEDGQISAEQKAMISQTTQLIDNYEQWKGLGFGIAYGIGFPRQRVIEGHEIVNNIVRVTNERSAVQSVLLESHYFIPLRRPAEASKRQTLRILNEEMKKGSYSATAANNYARAEDDYDAARALRGVGVGPFVCIIPGTDKFLKALGFGLMLGLRRGTTSNSFNVGIGYINYSDMPSLADGVEGDSALPANYNNPIKIGNVGGVLVLFSFSF